MPRHSVNAAKTPLKYGAEQWVVVRTWLARLWVILITVSVTAYGIREMHAVLSVSSVTVLQWGFLALFSINFAWIAFAFAQASLGFLGGLFGGLRTPRASEADLTIKTAILIPTYNEEPLRVAAAIRVMRAGLAEQAPGCFAFFILSDSNCSASWVQEEAVFRHLVADDDAACRVYYRHRRDNAERKAGNIADWVMQFGGGYEAMLILDADSVLAPESAITLAQRLAAAPGLGLIQTLPDIVRARSLYGRLQQFANQCYGPIYARGLAYWHGWSSNYWGHNAIIRTRAFADACGLPLLDGRPPFGGHVLSHDFIEAAMLRRAGWGVRFDCDIPYSFEEAPPSLADVIVRDRRWCQGNLQHIRFVFARGFTLASRMHLLTGILSYLSAVFWLALVLLGLAIALQATLVRPEYFAEPALFPSWPVFDAERARWLFGLSMAVLLAPKLLGGVLVLVQPRRLLRFGGPLLLPSIVLEVLLSALYAPILMLAQTRAVWLVLRGLDGGWQPQSRDDGALTFPAALRAHWGHTSVGVLLAATAWLLAPDLFFWLLPINAGLLLSVPLSWISGGAHFGRIFDGLGLLRAPEERRFSPVISALRAEIVRSDQSQASSEQVLLRLAADRDLCTWHLAQLPASAGNSNPRSFDVDGLTARHKIARSQCLHELQAWLIEAEQKAILEDREALLSALAKPLESTAASAAQDARPAEISPAEVRRA